MRNRSEGAIAGDRDPCVAETPKRQTEACARRGATVATRVAIGSLVVCTALISAFGLGFLWFCTWVALSEPPADVHADGIVVLTGGRDRVVGAVELLEEGRGRRLLISGVNPTTRAEDIRKATVADRRLFDCCVDLGHRAESTIGNAMEAAEWARAHGFKSLIVVTSAYHMPRSMLELDKVMPGVEKVPWPVRRNDLHIDRWFLHGATAKLLLNEYVKYMVTRFGPTASLVHPGESVAALGGR